MLAKLLMNWRPMLLALLTTLQISPPSNYGLMLHGTETSTSSHSWTKLDLPKTRWTSSTIPLKMALSVTSLLKLTSTMLPNTTVPMVISSLPTVPLSNLPYSSGDLVMLQNIPSSAILIILPLLTLWLTGELT
jgi:hypothetical protein